MSPSTAAPLLTVRDLEAQAAAAERRYHYHRERFNDALAVLRWLGADCPGVECLHVRQAGRELAACEPARIENAVGAFSLAILSRARRCDTAEEAEALARLSRQASHSLRDLAHQVVRQVEERRRVLGLRLLVSQTAKRIGNAGDMIEVIH